MSLSFRSAATAATDATRARRAITLLELLITLTLLVALGAISFSLMVHRLDERAFEAAAQLTIDQLLLARAEAQTSGEPVEVVALSGPTRIEARSFRVPRGSPGGGAATTGEPLEVIGDVEADPDDAVDPLFEGWAYRVLPRGVKINRHPPPDLYTSAVSPRTAFDMSEPWPEDETEVFGAPETPAALRLAIFLPDGSALLAQTVWLTDGDGRLGRLEVQAWTGLPVFRRLIDIPLDGEPLDGEPLEDEPEDERVERSPR